MVNRQPAMDRGAPSDGTHDIEALHANAVALADPELLLAALASWKMDPGMIDRYRDAFRPRSQDWSFRKYDISAYEVDQATLAEIRAEVIEALRGNEGPAARGHDDDPFRSVDDETFRAMASFVVGREVDANYVPMLREQSGFERDRRHVAATRRPRPDFEVAVIGAGMSGINAGVKLGDAGFGYTIFEEREGLGGTWLINTYPGAAVDTPSHYYSFSFDMNPDWQRYYPVGSEYLAYLRRIADRHGVTGNIRFNTRVVACEWDEGRRQWRLTTQTDGHRGTHWANAVVTALGFLNRPNKPSLPGMRDFRGATIHSAEWDETVELAGKKVLLLGAGCTAVQIAAALADIVEKLTIVQRHPQWIVPARTETPVPEAERWLLANMPYYYQWYRLRTFWLAGAGAGVSNWNPVRVDPDWAADHLSISPANDMLLQSCLTYIEKTFADRPDLKAQLVPDYPPLTKRIILDPGYYPVLKRANVALHTGSIERLEEDAAILSDGTRVPCDVLVLATGFKADWLGTIDIVGRDGVSLAEVWGDSPEAYLGMCIPGFPNLFTTCGPNTAPAAGGHNLTTEEQVHFIMECLQLMVERDLATIEPTREATDAYNRRVEEAMDETVWQHPRVRSYQHNAAGRAFVASPWRAVDYWSWVREPRTEDFVLGS